ncbi:MAG: hypothetical protein BIFFINMI_00930 [Phycisphaerae bacterium]|nr:hypothetical protein [Phycisphaerae bacterium]
MITITKKVFLAHGHGGRKRLIDKTPAVQQVGPGRTPRISKVMALAIKFDGLLQDGTVADQSELARLAHVTQPRMTQIMNLLHLAPDIQEELLFLPPVVKGRDPIHERMLRPVAAAVDWAVQRQAWTRLRRERAE